MACAALFSVAVWSAGSAQTVPKKKTQPKAPSTTAPLVARPMGPPAPDPKLLALPPAEKFVYGVQWRLIRAGTVTIEEHPSSAGQPPSLAMRLESGGLVASLFKVDDTYNATYDQSDPHYCATLTRLESREGQRHHEAQVTYDRTANRAHYIERDLATNQTLREMSVDLPACASDPLGAFVRLRGMPAEPGGSFEIPVSDGRHSALVRIEPQEREEVKVPAGTFKTMRYEAFLLNGVVYPRKGRLWVWYTDDTRRLPVQIRLRTGFPVGTVTLELEKQEGP